MLDFRAPACCAFLACPPQEPRRTKERHRRETTTSNSRLNSAAGSPSRRRQATYDTFVNLQQGPRLLGFSMEMHSLDHHDALFDRLYFSNFGYGGDPNDVSRLRISKNKRYDFDALFRRDENVSNYSLLANPLNPDHVYECSGGFQSHDRKFAPPVQHPSADERLQFDVAPAIKIRFRMGYSRNVNEGPSFTTIHQGTEQLLFQD